MIQRVRQSWERIPAAHRQVLLLGVVLTVTAWIMVTILDDGPGNRQLSTQQLEKQPKGISEQLLTDVDPRDLGIDGLANRVLQLEQALREAQGKIDQRSSRERRLDEQQLRKLREAQQQKLHELEQSIAELRERSLESEESPSAGEPETLPAAPADSVLEAKPPASANWVAPDTPPAPPRPLEIRQIRSQEETIADQSSIASAHNTSEPEEDLIVPAGSILQGVLLSGMDAPTGRLARRDPYPALIRIKDNAILPNFFRAEVNECFVTVAGFGELSSERAYLRSELITCVRKDGGVIEVPIDGYAVGEDGKLGLRGRVVSKQGQVIARAMQVAFLEGVSSIFNQRPVPVISTDPDSSAFQEVLSKDSAQAGAITGTGRALDRLAQYYLDMAQDIFPIIEIDAGRSVELILNRGVFMTLASDAGA